jgi:hypothetical protein
MNRRKYDILKGLTLLWIPENNNYIINIELQKHFILTSKNTSKSKICKRKLAFLLFIIFYSNWIQNLFFDKKNIISSKAMMHTLALGLKLGFRAGANSRGKWNAHFFEALERRAFTERQVSKIHELKGILWHKIC